MEFIEHFLDDPMSRPPERSFAGTDVKDYWPWIDENIKNKNKNKKAARRRKNKAARKARRIQRRKK